MKKVINETQYTCDDCGKMSTSYCHDTPYRVDFCYRCLERRVKYTVQRIGLRTNCPMCGGKGVTKDFYGHNDYHLEDCKACLARKEELESDPK